MSKLTEKEQKAIEILKAHNWQVVDRPHLEDWDEHCLVEVDGQKEISIKADIAIIKVDL